MSPLSIYFGTSEKVRAFEQGLTRYRDRVGNLNIPLFYVDENKLPLGRMLSCLYEKWEWDETRGKRETDWSGFEVRETLAEIDSLRDKFFDPGLWPRWKKLRWRIADQVRAKRDNYLDKLPGPVPSLSEIGGTPGTFYVLLYLFLVNKGQVSRPQTETEERLRDIFPWEAFSPEARGNKALGAVLKKCRLQLTTDQEVDPFVQKVILEKLDSEERPETQHLDAYYELIDSLDAADPSALRAFLEDIEVADKRYGHFDERAPGSLTNLLWDLGDISDQDSVTVRGCHTQLLGTSLLRALDGKKVNQLNAIFHNWSTPHEFNDSYHGPIAIAKARLLSELVAIGQIDLKLLPLYGVPSPEADVVVELPSLDMEVDDEYHPGYRLLEKNLGGSAKGRYVDLEWIMLTRLAESLRPNGKAITVVSDRVLYSTSRKYLNLRRSLLQDFCVEHVISIEDYPEFEQKRNILIFSRKPQRSEVRFSALRLRRDDSDYEKSENDLETRKGFQEWLGNLSTLTPRNPESEGLGIPLFNKFDKSQNQNLNLNLKVIDSWTESIEDIKEKQFTLLPRNLQATEWGKFLQRVSGLDDVKVFCLGELFEVAPSSIPKPNSGEEQKEVPLFEISRIQEEVLHNERVVRLIPPRKTVMIPLNSAPDRTIQRNDIAIAVKGTIGKVVRFYPLWPASPKIVDGRKTYVGGVAASTVSLLRIKPLTPDMVKFFESWPEFSSGKNKEQKTEYYVRDHLPEYVEEILGFEGVKAWLSAVSLGTTIPYITKKELLNLPIPVPSDGKVYRRFDRAVTFHNSRSTTDHMSTLWNVLSGEHNPYQQLLESKEAKALDEFVAQLRSKGRDSSLMIEMGEEYDPMPAVPKLYNFISGKSQKGLSFADAPKDPLYEMRSLVFSMLEKGHRVAYEVELGWKKDRSGEDLPLIDRHFLRSMRSLTKEMLEGILAVDDPLQRYSMWHEALSKIIGVETYWETRCFDNEQWFFDKDKRHLRGDLSYFDSDPFWLLLGLATYIEAEIDRLSLDVDLDLHITYRGELVGGGRITVGVGNNSRLPLQWVSLQDVAVETFSATGEPRDILCEFSDEAQHIDARVLAPGESYFVAVFLPVELPEQQTEFNINVRVTGRTPRYDFSVSSLIEDWAWNSEGFVEETIYKQAPRLRISRGANGSERKSSISKDSVNPYIVGNPIDRKEMLFGRDDILLRIKQQLGSKDKQSNPVLIEGNRRVGKTSILKELQRSLNPAEIIPVYVSMHSGDGSISGKIGLDTVEVFRLISREIGKALKRADIEVELPGEELTDPSKKFSPQFTKKLTRVFDTSRPFEVFEQYIEEVLNQISPRKLLLMLDEFDRIHMGISSGVTSHQVPDNIRSLVHQHPSLSLIISGTKELRKIRGDYWSALFGFAVPISVSALSAEEAARLVEEPSRGMLSFRPTAIGEIVRLAAREPFLIQTLCTHLFGIAVEGEHPSLDFDEVSQAAERMTHESNGHFRDLFWRDIETDQQRLIYLAILEAYDNQSIPGLAGIQSELFAMQVTYDEETLESDLEHLVELEIVERGKSKSQLRSTSDAHYGSSVPLFERWVRQNVDEVDLLVRAAEQLS